VFFFTIAAATGWVFYVAIQTGVPAQLAANVAKLSPGFVHGFSAPGLTFAVLGTLAWLWLVRWRTRRSRHPLWKSLVLPAGGVSLCWLLVMTLLLPPLDNARSYRSMVQRIARQVPAEGCVAAPGMARAQVVALEYLGHYRIDAVTPETQTRCDVLMLPRPQGKPSTRWQFIGRERRNRNDDDDVDLYRRVPPR
jgi:4-amino-4-deoxy-L-arabinose transferase-like glycosyltransferase